MHLVQLVLLLVGLALSDAAVPRLLRANEALLPGASTALPPLTPEVFSVAVAATGPEASDSASSTLIVPLGIFAAVVGVVAIALIAKAVRNRMETPGTPQTPPPMAMCEDEFMRVSASTPVHHASL
ncbi:hypothetical protein ACHHYP_08417 [Achlya hypogyna]|uniref:Secreted protein n=1 Tax=Achlya hypogyna TaxID=1202772 RepID=A0A1V9YPM8_ACHHY|nr:hypothetical protein ACHHYP_08417 [Achlya hypogyna]